MCQFNFLVLKNISSPTKIGKVASEYNLNFVKRNFNSADKNKLEIYQTTTGNCDCGSVLGKNYSDDNKKPDWNKERKKLERKRFSERRIDLLLEQKRKEYSEKHSDEIQSELSEMKKWADFLNDERLIKKSAEIGFFYHQFDGEIENERINFRNEKIVTSDQINVEFLREITENELIWVK